MEEEAPTPEELREFVGSLTRSGTLVAIDAFGFVERGLLRLDVTYRFRDSETPDGRPVAMGRPLRHLELLSIDADGARVLDLESNDRLGPSGMQAMVVEPDGHGWNDVVLTARFEWPAPSPAKEETSFLVLPDDLFFVANGFTTQFELPTFSLLLDDSARECLVGGAAFGSNWPAESQSMPLLQAILARPDAGLVVVPIVMQNSDFGFVCTQSVLAASTHEQRMKFAAVSVLGQFGLSLPFESPVVTRTVIATDAEVKAASPSAPNLLAFYPTAADFEPTNPFGVWLRQSRIWWGCGLRLFGVHSESLNTAITIAVALCLLENHFGTVVTGDALVAEALARALPGANKSQIDIAALTASILSAIRNDEDTRRAITDLTKAWWGRAVPDREFSAWCLSRGISVPSALIASE